MGYFYKKLWDTFTSNALSNLFFNLAHIGMKFWGRYVASYRSAYSLKRDYIAP